MRIIPAALVLLIMVSPAAALEYPCPSDPGFCYRDVADDRGRVAHRHRPGIGRTAKRRRGGRRTDDQRCVIHQLQAVHPLLAYERELGPQSRPLHLQGQSASQPHDHQHAHGKNHQGADDFDQREAVRRKP